MFAAYRPLFARPEARRLVLASTLGRLPFGIFDLPLILLVQEASGSYAVAGAAVGAHAVGVALSAPPRGRLLDRRGSRRALPPLAFAQAATIGGLPLAAAADAVWALVLLSALEGVTAPPLVAGMRLEWQQMLGREDPRLQQAYAFESALQVAVFVAGPLLAGAGIVLVGASATLAACAALALAGGLLFASRARAVPVQAPAAGAGLGPIRLPGVRTLVVATALADVGLGVVDVAAVAFAQERGQPGQGGVLLALFALGALAGGAAYGTRAWTAPPELRLAALMGVAAVLLLPLALADSVLVLAFLLLLAGAPSTAQFATSSHALDGVVPAGADAEAFNWLSTANATGFALGGVVAGVLVETSGTPAAFLAGAGSLALAAAFVWMRSGQAGRARGSLPSKP
jgi:MFS family permease